MADASPTPESVQGQAPAAPVVPDRYEELARSYQEMQGQLAAIAQAVVQREVQPVTQQSVGQVTEDELFERARQGDRQAFREYQQRVADERVNDRFYQAQQAQATQAQINVLYQNYPEFSDPRSPIHQKANQFKAALTAMGSPNSRDTDLQAMLRAVADSRQILSPGVAAQHRVAAQQGVAAQTGVSHAAPTAPVVNTPVSKLESDMAKKFGVKDPGAALKRFWERQDQGRSSVSPTIQSALNAGQGV